MGRAISNRNVLTAKFEVAEFDGDFLASFGKPELRGAWIIYGGSGCGKTTFVMQVCKYLTRFRRVAYNSLEQGLSLSLQKAWERVGMEEAGSRIILLNKEQLKDLRVRLQKKQSPDIVVIDSVQYLRRFNMDQYQSLRDEFPNKLFIFVNTLDYVCRHFLNKVNRVIHVELIKDFLELVVGKAADKLFLKIAFHFDE